MLSRWPTLSVVLGTGKDEADSVAKVRLEMSKLLKPIPKFASEAEERAFWELPGNNSADYVDWGKARLATFPKLKPSTETISTRMPEDILNTIRSHARRLDVPYQSLIKLWRAEKVALQANRPRTARQGKG